MSRRRSRTFAQVDAARLPCPTAGCANRRHYSESVCLDCKVRAHRGAADVARGECMCDHETRCAACQGAR